VQWVGRLGLLALFGRMGTTYRTFLRSKHDLLCSVVNFAWVEILKDILRVHNHFGYRTALGCFADLLGMGHTDF
jgi:hypothetical protein